MLSGNISDAIQGDKSETLNSVLPSILISAYACCPNRGSEPGMGWNWCVNLAEYCELYIITEGEFRDKIEAALPSLPQGKNMHFYYNSVSEKVREMCRNQGDWRFYWYYKKWQQKTYQLALEIMRTNKIDIVHQLNMIGFREPGYLWKIERVPFVWGPVNAKKPIPEPYLKNGDWKMKLFYKFKNSISGFQLKYSYRVRSAARKTNFLVAASSDSGNMLKKYFNRKSVIINESGCYLVSSPTTHNYTNKGSFDLLWVGRFIFTKQLEIAIRTISESRNKNLIIHVVGGAEKDEIYYKEIADKLNVKSQCKWYQILPHHEVIELMKKCDVLFFTSISEGTPHVILEAISNSLPIVCFDTCGQGDVVNEAVGIKIPLSNPEQSVSDFADKINYLYHHREVLKQLSANCYERQDQLSWSNKARQMVGLYEKALAGFQSADAE